MIDLLHDSYGLKAEDGDKEALELIGAHTADFVAAKDIGSIVFLDSAARNAHIPISAAMQQLYPERDVDFYFLNPAGLAEEEVYYSIANSQEIRGLIATGLNADTEAMDAFIGKVGLNLCHAAMMYKEAIDGYKYLGAPQSQADIKRTLIDNRTRMSKMAHNPDNKNTLIFDQCMHRGVSLRASKESLENAFPDQTFYTGVVDLDDEFTDYKPDFVVFQPEQFELIGCSYFGRSTAASQIGRLDSRVDGIRDKQAEMFSRRRELVRICKQLDYS